MVRFSFICFLPFTLLSCTQPAIKTLTQPSEPSLNQFTIHRSACGPCALVHAFAHASADWRKHSLFQQSQADQAKKIISGLEAKQPNNTRHNPRWSATKGMNTTDLLSTANAISPYSLTNTSTLRNSHETSESWLDRIHTTLQESLHQGFPPIANLKQQIHKKFNSKAGYYWIKTKGHFITITEISPIAPSTPSAPGQFQFKYVDSYDGANHVGVISSSTTTFKTTSPLTRKTIFWNPHHIQADLPKLQISRYDSPANAKVTTEIASFIVSP